MTPNILLKFIIIFIIAASSFVCKKEEPKVLKRKSFIYYYNDFLEQKGFSYRLRPYLNRFELLLKDKIDKDENTPKIFTIDIDNGYLVHLLGCQCHGVFTIISLYYDNCNNPFLAISEIGNNRKNIEFYNYNNKWINIANTVFPKIGYELYLDEKDKLYRINKKVLNLIDYSYRLPQYGTIIKIYININYLNQILNSHIIIGPDHPDYVEKIDKTYYSDENLKISIRDFLQKVKYEYIELKWDMKDAKFEISKKVNYTSSPFDILTYWRPSP
jgi:hypothetical protein